MYTTADLSNVVDKLNARDRDFAMDLIRKGAKWDLSEKQLFWVDKLCKQARGEAVKRAAVAIGDLKKVIELFDAAGQHIRRPKVTLNTGAATIRITIASDNAKVPGSLNVTSLGQFDSRDWYGRITRDGVFHPSNAAEKVSGLVETLKAFAADPAGMASKQGAMSKSCCFCSKTLDTEASKAVGYGPDCADHYGLPWGTKKAA